MARFFLLIGALLFSTGTFAAEQIIRTGSAYATVEVLPNGDIEVVDVSSDLPEDTNPAISDWLQRQTIELAADVDASPPNRTTVQIDYSVVEDDQGGQGLILKIAATGVGMPERRVALETTAVKVRVRVREDGSVAFVRPLTPLPEGVTAEDIERTVRQDIENDPDIREAAAENRLADATHTLTVQVRPRN